METKIMNHNENWRKNLKPKVKALYPIDNHIKKTVEDILNLYREELEPQIETLLKSEREAAYKEVIEKVDWILTPHAYESDDPKYERFALKLKEHYKKEIIDAIANHIQRSK